MRLIRCRIKENADHSGRAVYGVGLRPLAGWDYGFEFHLAHGCVFWVLCVVRQRSLRRTDHSSRGVLPSLVCLPECEQGTSHRRPRPTRTVEPWEKKKTIKVNKTCDHNIQYSLIMDRNIKFVVGIYTGGYTYKLCSNIVLIQSLYISKEWRLQRM